MYILLKVFEDNQFYKQQNDKHGVYSRDKLSSSKLALVILPLCFSYDEFL